MRKHAFLHYAAGLMLLPICVMPIVSCSSNNSYTFVVETNLSNQQGSISNLKANIIEDYETDATILNNNKCENIIVFSNKKQLAKDTDYSFTFVANNKIHIKILKHALQNPNIFIRFIFDNFKVNFYSSTGKASIQNVDAKINQNFDTTINIEENYSFASIEVFSHSKFLRKDEDFFYLIENNIFSLCVFAESIVDNDLQINFNVAEQTYDVSLSLTKGVGGHISNTVAKKFMDFETVITIDSFPDRRQDYISYYFKSLSVNYFEGSNKKYLKNNDDYKYTFDDNKVKLTIYATPLFEKKLNIDLELDTKKSIDLTNLSYESYILSGLAPNFKIDKFDSLFIPSFTSIIFKNAFKDKFVYDYNNLHYYIDSLIFNPLQKLSIIEESAFEGCNALRNILKIPQNIQDIKKCAFKNCSSITAIDMSKFTSLPNWLKVEHNNIFENISKDGTVGFEKSDNLSIEIFNAMKSNALLPSNWVYKTFVPKDDFDFSLADSEIRGLKKTENLDKNNFLSLDNEDIFYIADDAFSAVKNKDYEKLSRLYLNSNLKSIGKNAFKNCVGLSGPLSFPNKYLSLIDDSAFEGCTNLSGKLVLPDQINQINKYCFKNCANLTGELIFPKSVTHIGVEAFFGCSKINSIIFHDQLTEVDAYAFGNCSSIKTIDVSCYKSFDSAPWITHTGKLFFAAPPNGKVIVHNKGMIDQWKKIMARQDLPNNWTYEAKEDQLH